MLIQISNRVVELEKFYEDNIFDSRITAFEKARLKLKKLLKYENEAEHENNPNLTFHKLNSERSKNPAANPKDAALNSSVVSANPPQKTLETKKISIEKIPVRKPFGANPGSTKKARTGSVETKGTLRSAKASGKDKLNNSMVAGDTKQEKKKDNPVQSARNNLDIATSKVNMSMNAGVTEKKKSINTQSKAPQGKSILNKLRKRMFKEEDYLIT